MNELAESLHVAESEVRFYGVMLQTRMAVLVLPGDRLIVYSPVWLTPGLRSELDALGQVSAIVSPNKIHNQTLPEYARAYPDARVLVPPGLAERCPKLRVDAVLDDSEPPEWHGVVDLALTAGNVFFSEALLLHRPSRTLLVGDLVENIDASTTSALGRAAARLFGVGQKPVASPEFRYYTHDPDAASRVFDRVASWEFERIFLCHGGLIESDAKRVFRGVIDDLLRVVRGRSAVSRFVLRQMAKLQ